jgi:hypothetical protein
MATGVPVGVIMPLLRFGYWSLVGLSLAAEIAAFLLMGCRRCLHLQLYAAAAGSRSSF